MGWGDLGVLSLPLERNGGAALLHSPGESPSWNCSLLWFFISFAGFALAVTEKQKLKTLLLWWQMGFGGHLFLQGKNVCPTYDFICVETLQCGWGRDAELFMPDLSNQALHRKCQKLGHFFCLSYFMRIVQSHRNSMSEEKYAGWYCKCPTGNRIRLNKCKSIACMINLYVLLNPLELLIQYRASLVVMALWWHIFATADNQRIEWSMLPALWDKHATFSFQSLWVPPETWTPFFPHWQTCNWFIKDAAQNPKVSQRHVSPFEVERIRYSGGCDFQCDISGAQLPPDYAELGTICPAFMSLNVKEPKTNKPPCEAEGEWCNSPILGLDEAIKGQRTKTSCSVCRRLNLLWPP